MLNLKFTMSLDSVYQTVGKYETNSVEVIMPVDIRAKQLMTLTKCLKNPDI